MFNLSFSELIVLFLIVLFVLGPEQAPKFFKSILSTMNELKNSFHKIKRNLKSINEEAEGMFLEEKSTIEKSIGSMKKEVEQVKKNFDIEKLDKDLK